MTKPYPEPSLPVGRPLDVSALCGDWVNPDHRGAAGMLGLTVTEDDGGLWVRVARHGEAGRVRLGPGSCLADYDFGFMRTVISATASSAF